MRKKVTPLNEDESAKKIKDITISALNEMDGATLYNASHKANEPTVQEYWLKEYKGQTFKFYGEDGMGLITHILFTFDKVTKLDKNKTILIGTVIFNDTQISGDGIIVNFEKGEVRYHERGNRYSYSLETDNRTAPLWNGLLEQLKMALDNRKSSK
ncbi:MAG: hypothetical protein MJZ19_06110 [Paludibacteraceae bacterium]|nr:hypothetical protein [Paludibacteraceae bacterium]